MLGNNDVEEIKIQIQVSLNPKLCFFFSSYQTASFEIIYWSTEMASLNKNKLDKSSY